MIKLDMIQILTSEVLICDNVTEKTNNF